jgi:hypothetical protein
VLPIGVLKRKVPVFDRTPEFGTFALKRSPVVGSFGSGALRASSEVIGSMGRPITVGSVNRLIVWIDPFVIPAGQGGVAFGGGAPQVAR